MLAIVVLQQGKGLPLTLTQRCQVWDLTALGLASSFNIFLFTTYIIPDSFNYKIIYSVKTSFDCQHMTKLKSGPKLRLTQVQQ